MSMSTSRCASARIVRVFVAALVAATGLVLAAPAANAAAAEQVIGTAVPYPAAPETCDPAAAGEETEYILAMSAGSGSLVGCVYGVVDNFRASPGGQYLERSTETFIGCLGDRCGSFQLDATITSRWINGEPFAGGEQVNGRCQHKVIRGSGTGDFAGVEGRIDFKDILERDADGNVIGVTYDYKGHLK